MFLSLINCPFHAFLVSNSAVELQYSFLFFLCISQRAFRYNSQYFRAFFLLSSRARAKFPAGLCPCTSDMVKVPGERHGVTCDLRHTLALTMASICGSRVSGPPFITYTAMVMSSADLRGGVHLGGGREWQVRLYSWLLLTWLTSPLGSPASARLIAMASVSFIFH